MGDSIAEDLWPEILSRIPVKSLLRFRCVSKPWKSLIADPEFCQSHYNSFKNNCHQTHLLFQQAGVSRVEYVVSCSNTMETTAVLGATLFRNSGVITTLHTSEYPGMWVIQGHVNGLCLLIRHPWGGPMLWNPSIRKFRSIPPSPEISSDDIRSMDLGLGFDALSSDYKLVRLVCQDLLAVYSVMTGSWKVIQFPGKRWSNWRWPGFRYHQYNPVCFQGYMCFNVQSVDDGIDLLVSFDLRREVFASIPMPKAWNYEGLRVVNDECLWVKFDYKTGKGSIWVLEGGAGDFESMCWKQRRSFNTGTPSVLLHVFKNGDMLLQSLQMRLGNKKVLIRFNLETLEKNIIEERNDDHLDIDFAYEYDESLMLLE